MYEMGSHGISTSAEPVAYGAGSMEGPDDDDE